MEHKDQPLHASASEAITNNVRVEVESQFVPDRSQPFECGGSGDASADDALGRRHEVRHVFLDLEAEKIRAEHAVDQLTSPRKDREELCVRERDVEKEADAQVGSS